MENTRIKAVSATLAKDFPQQSEALSEASPILVFDTGEWETFLYSYAHHRIHDFMHKYHVGQARIHYEAAYILMAIDEDEIDAANMILDNWKTVAREVLQSAIDGYGHVPIFLLGLQHMLGGDIETPKP